MYVEEKHELRLLSLVSSSLYTPPLLLFLPLLLFSCVCRQRQRDEQPQGARVENEKELIASVSVPSAPCTHRYSPVRVHCDSLSISSGYIHISPLALACRWVPQFLGRSLLIHAILHTFSYTICSSPLFPYSGKSDAMRLGKRYGERTNEEAIMPETRVREKRRKEREKTRDGKENEERERR